MFFIRADASIALGSGHVMRCLTLADLLRQKGHKVCFLCRSVEGNLNSYIEHRGYHVIGLLEREFSWREDALEVISQINLQRDSDNILLVDHYEVDCRWESLLRRCVSKIFVIDDLANRNHDCDWLLDQNLCANYLTRYKNLVSSSCQQFLGPNYALLRPEYINSRQYVKARDEGVRRILIFFGGSDPGNETEKALNALKMVGRPDIQTDVVVGGINPHKQSIQNLCRTNSNWKLHCQVSNMAELIAKADLAIGAGGTTTWERCYLGLPTISLIIAENQKHLTNYLEYLNVLLNLGVSHEVSAEQIAKSIHMLLSDSLMLRRMSQRAMDIMKRNLVQSEILPSLTS